MGSFAVLIVLAVIAFAVVSRMRNHADTQKLRSEVADLRAMLLALRTELDFSRAKPDDEKPSDGYVKAPSPKPAAAPTQATRVEPRSVPIAPAPSQPARAAEPAATKADAGPFGQSPTRPPPQKPIDFEQQFGARLPVWVGGIAMALAGIFLVKYSIDTGLLSPPVRCVLGGLFGIALLAAAQWMRARLAIANGERIAQALSGAGIAALYGTLFAATSLYELIPPALGFAGMAVVTASAVLLSLRHGAPIAVLGLVGGFLTPLLIRSDAPNAPVLFTYLFALTAGLFLLIRHRNWWWMAWPTIGAAFLWLGIWIAFFSVPGDSFWLSLFLLASVAVVVGATTRRAVLPYEGQGEHAEAAPSIFGMSVLGAALLFMAAITVRAHFDLSQWILYGMLAVASIALAAYNERYRIAPWLSLGVSIAMLIGWDTPLAEVFAATLIAFAVLFAASGYVLMWQGRDAASWALLSAVSALLFYLLAYARLKEFSDVWAVVAAASHASIYPLWGGIAMALSVLATLATGRVMEAFAGSAAEKQRLLAIFAVAATSFLSLALGIELKREFLSVALAAQILMLAWLDTRVEITALRRIAVVVAIAFAVLLGPQIMLLIELTGYAVAEARLYAINELPVVTSPLFQLGLPALMFAGAAYFLRQRKDDGLVRAFEGAAIALLGVMGYYLIRYAFYSGSDVLFAPGTFFERGIITNALFLYALALMWTAQRFVRPAVMWGGLTIGGIAVFRVLFFDILISNPLIVAHDVGSWPLINYLLLPYGLPVVWLWLGIRFAPRDIAHPNERLIAPFMAAASLVLAFVLVSLNVRQIYQGPQLNGSYTSDAEIYTYSFVWLIGGIALLFMGTLRKDKLIRYVSLALMVLTVAKVFLYDASALTGLLRVFSFFGLGLSLLGLSWFYTRFVFVPETRAN